jgi:lysophospholipase L1-like esterase
MTRALILAAALAWSLAGSLAAAQTAAQTAPWLPAWTASPEPSDHPEKTIADQTLRQVVRLGADGRGVRIEISNAYGKSDLHIDRASLAARAAGAAIRPETLTAVTFSGRPDATVPPGAFVVSDPVPFAATAAADVAVSLYVRGPAELSTVHLTQRKAIYAAAGDQTSAPDLPTGLEPPVFNWGVWLSAVEVAPSSAPSSAKGVIVALGDSITDGANLKADAELAWPDALGDRLRAHGAPFTVVNAGISGGRLLHPGAWAPFGDAALARFDRDVLAQPRLRAVIALIGVNDIGQYGAGALEHATPEAIEAGLTQLAIRAHAQGVKIYVATLTPFGGTTIKAYDSDAKQADRAAVNAWIRTSSAFDGVVDFDKVLQDPSAPLRLRADYDSGDHLHPSAAGEAAMAGAVPLVWFQ